MIHIDGRPEAKDKRTLPSEPRPYRKTAVTMAIQMPEDFAVETQEKRDGKEDFGVAGDYLCIGSDGECWINKRANFEATYELIHEVAPRHPWHPTEHCG